MKLAKDMSDLEFATLLRKIIADLKHLKDLSPSMLRSQMLIDLVSTRLRDAGVKGDILKPYTNDREKMEAFAAYLLWASEQNLRQYVIIAMERVDYWVPQIKVVH
jgi:hypothetical protein